MAGAARAGSPAPPERLILDSGAVVAWSRADLRARSFLRQAVGRGLDVRVPVAVLAETLRGGPGDAAVNRVLKAVDVLPTEPAVGRTAGRLLGGTAGKNTVDALVAAEAVETSGATVLTGDPVDLGALLADHPEVAVVRL